ncbi:MAG: SMI1/KNR4 family protein [Acetatifactor sp.]|nr:SMI1/KNR4 family protein [Acetatifactor sp.]
MDYNINRLLQIQQRNNKKNLWEEVEKKIGITFPEDYKLFIDSYGEGGINEFLWILSPFSENENLNSIEQFKLMQDAYISMQREFPEQFSFDFYNGKSGLFPWGVTDNGDELFWNFNGDTLEIVVYESRYVSNMSYIMSMEEFLYKLLKKEIECPIFPDDFISESNYYETI